MSGKELKRGGNIVYRLLSQDLYATGIHADKVGIKKDEDWRSKSRQFTQDSDIIGKIDESKLKKGTKELPPREKIGFITIRNGQWRDEKNEMSRRLVCKLFSNNGNWIASLEEMVAEECALSFASEAPYLVFSVLTKESDVVTYIRQAKRSALATESYSFYIVGPQGNFEVFRIEGARVSVGDDFTVRMLAYDTPVAKVDSKFGDIGGDFTVTVNDEVLAENEWFCRVLQCFAIALKYRHEIRERLDKGLKAWAGGKSHPTQHRYELSLLANPRRLTLKADEFDEV
ncbi:MAG: hypothetical protein C4K49_10070 [Candidatus Thorarchaeota archaeon]|nr:MAG: hypothetical protein C4K49_10070 [Candidatus Thorarchaeota archaeon]